MASKGRLIGSAEFGVFEKRNNGSGEVEYESISTVNKQLKVSPADVIRTIARKRIEVREIEDKDLDGDTFYNKKVNTKQIEEESDEGSNSTKSKGRSEPESNGNGKEPSGLQVLKNFVDKIADVVKTHGAILVGLGVISGLALALSIVAVAK